MNAARRITAVFGALIAIVVADGTVAGAEQHEYEGTVGLWFCPDNNYGVNDTSQYLKWMNEHPDWLGNPAFHNLNVHGGSVYSIEQPDRFAKILRGMRRATADVIVVDPMDEHTDPWSAAMHYFVSFRQACVGPRADLFLREIGRQDSAHRGAPDLETAGDLGFADAGAR